MYIAGNHTTPHQSNLVPTGSLQMQEYGTITMFRGGDATFSLFFPGTGSQPLNITGHTVIPFEPHALLENNISLVIEDPLLGQVSGVIKWDPSYKLGASMSFYIQLSIDEILISAPKLVVRVV